MNRYRQKIQPGDRLFVTYDLVEHFKLIGVEFSREFGYELMVVADDWRAPLPIRVVDPADLTWGASIDRMVAIEARNFRYKFFELLPENEGVSELLPAFYWNSAYKALSHSERAAAWQTALVDLDAGWDLFVRFVQRDSSRK